MEKVIYPLSHLQFNQQIPGVTLEILNHSHILTFDNGEFITKEGGHLNHLYFIIKGRAKVVATQDNGKRIILQFLAVDDLIGDLTVIQAEDEIKDVIAMGKTICLGIPIKIVEEMLITNNDFLFYLSHYIGTKLLLRMDHFKEQQTQEVKVRLAKLLIEIAVNDEYHEKHTEIAEYLGVSYRHFMHTFKQLKDEGMVEKKSNHYMINQEKIKTFLESV
ncbi:MAG: cyclic nucleotide-binding domain-containing protein [Vagococcus sp.]|uniref:cyclic nucleotide-binding domain-containing protein n=1 Tax=Vagococcus sp. TaxID=1933889 RepID=UPI002FC71B30